MSTLMRAAEREREREGEGWVKRSCGSGGFSKKVSSALTLRIEEKLGHGFAQLGLSNA